jgi:hypothetical protein
MQGLSGTLGDQLIIKSAKGGRTIISAKPVFSSERVFSQAQLEQQQAFREATAYGKTKKEDPIYIAKANGSPQSPYNIAVADWFKAPEILEIDLDGWNGQSGEVIRVRAQDNVLVQQVSVKITNGTPTPLEEGQASDAGALWWEYQATQNLAGPLTVTVYATDLPGHTAQASAQKDIQAA